MGFVKEGCMLIGCMLLAGWVLTPAQAGSRLASAEGLSVARDARSSALYDPVTAAIRAGRTPEAIDASIDAALSGAEDCPMVFDTRRLRASCWTPARAEPMS